MVPRLYHLIVCSLIVGIAFSLAPAGLAEGDDKAVILRLKNLTLPEGQNEVTFTREELDALPVTTIVTGNDFVDGKKRFEGPLARDVFAKLPMDGVKIARLKASNDYFVDVDIREFSLWDVVLSTSIDGVVHSKREYGPIWVMYPIDSHSVLQDPLYNNRLVWQLVEIEFLEVESE